MSDSEKQELERYYRERHNEYLCLLAAEEGNPEPLAELVEREGHLATAEAREYVAARLRGEKKRRGIKRTLSQITSRVVFFSANAVTSRAVKELAMFDTESNAREAFERR